MDALKRMVMWCGVAGFSGIAIMIQANLQNWGGVGLSCMLVALALYLAHGCYVVYMELE